MSGVSTHVLDTATGRPGADVPVTLARREADGRWTEVSRARTDDDGRVGDALGGATLEAGVYRMRFETGRWMDVRGGEGFYPHVDVVFRVDDPAGHYHVPLLLSPYGYTTYRGS